MHFRGCNCKKNPILIAGGAGLFGNATLNRFLAADIEKNIIFLRGVKKQDDMCHDFQIKTPEMAKKLNFILAQCLTFSRAQRHAL